jgi:EAL and modified HD-GYP domain-containing signal transduction protein
MPTRAVASVIVPPVPAGVPGPPTSFIARQPILDAQQRVFGYELLFRSGWENYFTGGSDVDAATRQMIDTTMFQGLETLVHGTRAFVNCNREALVSRLVTVLPPASTVLEILEGIAVDDEVLDACLELKAMGYQLALDDFVPGTSIDRLIPLADYVKLDLRACSQIHLREIQGQLRHSTAILLAEKVEDETEFKLAVAAGYKLFQGYFFAKPKIIASHEIAANRLVYLRLLAAVSESTTDRDEIERLVMADTSICFRLLRLVNSAGFGMRGRITSVRQALMMIGDKEFRKLVTVAAATCFGKGGDSAQALTTLCLHRARFCELLAPHAGQAAGEQYLIGMLSVVDAMLNVTMDRVIKVMPLRAAAADTLLRQESSVDLPLRLVQLYEQSDWESCAGFCRELRISEARLSELYFDSLQWASKQVLGAQ